MNICVIVKSWQNAHFTYRYTILCTKDIFPRIRFQWKCYTSWYYLFRLNWIICYRISNFHFQVIFGTFTFIGLSECRNEIVAIGKFQFCVKTNIVFHQDQTWFFDRFFWWQRNRCRCSTKVNNWDVVCIDYMATHWFWLYFLFTCLATWALVAFLTI